MIKIGSKVQIIGFRRKDAYNISRDLYVGKIGTVVQEDIASGQFKAYPGGIFSCYVKLNTLMTPYFIAVKLKEIK